MRPKVLFRRFATHMKSFWGCSKKRIQRFDAKKIGVVSEELSSDGSSLHIGNERIGTSEPAVIGWTSPRSKGGRTLANAASGRVEEEHLSQSRTILVAASR